MLITSGSGRVNLLYTPIGSFEFVTLNHWFFNSKWHGFVLQY